MKLWRTLRMLLPVLAIAGIVTAPLATPAAAGTMSAEQMTDMADDMPCCPPEKSAMPDCGEDCPLMTACPAKCFQNLSTAASTILLPLRVADLIVPSNDALGSSLAQAPPARPPRT